MNQLVVSALRVNGPALRPPRAMAEVGNLATRPPGGLCSDQADGRAITDPPPHLQEPLGP
jgi:hypothetical protein